MAPGRSAPSPSPSPPPRAPSPGTWTKPLPESIRNINAPDLTRPRNEYMFKSPSFIHSFLMTHINDPRDEIMLYTIFNIAVITLPSLALVFLLPHWFPACRPRHIQHIIGITYFATNFFLFIKRLNYMLHYSSHRKLFRTDNGVGKNSNTIGVVLNQVIPFVLAPCFGIPHGLYHFHHIIMHHGENNASPFDLSSTMPYQRDSPLHFLCYWARFTFAIFAQLAYYCLQRKNLKTFIHFCSCTTLYFSFGYLAYRLNPIAFIWVFLAPYLFICFALMFGNFAQHIFIDPARPHSNYGLTYNCINGAHNGISFNDGYHINHHVNASTHWSQLPVSFHQQIEKFVAEDVIIFHTLDYFVIGLLVMLRQWNFLAGYYIDLQERNRSKEEIIAMLKSRCVPIHTPPPNYKMSKAA
jgi:hypothetical protein